MYKALFLAADSEGKRERDREKKMKTNKPPFLILFFQLKLEFSFQLLRKPVVGAPGDSLPVGSLSSIQYKYGKRQSIAIPVP